MASILTMRGSVGADVDRLRVRLGEILGDPALLLGAAGEPIDAGLDAAIRRWQSGVGVIADGIVGPLGRTLLGLAEPVKPALQPPLDLQIATRLFPATKPANIARYLPYVEAALGVAGLTDRAMVVAALATIRAETEGFVPISEFPSRFNTRPGGAPFSAYDGRASLGNTEPGDGARYRGRGFVQLTGRANYATYGARVGLPLAAMPDLANAPEVAAVLLALFLHDRAPALRQALAEGEAGLAAARKLVNGGSHGLDRYSDVFRRAAPIWAEEVAEARAIRAAASAGVSTAASTRAKRTSQTRKDSADVRDRPFVPAPLNLPDVWPTEAAVGRFLPLYRQAGLVLDQGEEASCTGFGLACVVNYLSWVAAGNPTKVESVSPRMLYTLARRHDEYQGEDYEGSSCRGAIKGFFNHGVCVDSDWPASGPRYGYADRAARRTLGVYYRIDPRSIVDLQAAIHQHGAVFVSAYTHDGWDTVAAAPAPDGHAGLPRVAFDGRPSTVDAHAFAIVGFNGDGFILQNSWGEDWGAAGFAVVGYLDWLANGMDAWVLGLGVPGVVAGRLAGEAARGPALAGADRSRWWDEGLAYRHSVVLGNDGRVAKYLTEDEAPRKLAHQAFVLPDAWFRARAAAGPKRLVIYVHGGLNSEGDAIKRARAMGRYFVGNGCYPLFLVWKTGLMESIGNILADRFGGRGPAAGIGDWIADRTDAVIEKIVGRPLARPIWSEMKENAGLAFQARRGGDLLVEQLANLAGTWGDRFELHLIGHSAGSIALGHLLTALRAKTLPPKVEGGAERSLASWLASVHLYAPACTVEFANRHYAGDEATMGKLYLDVLADGVERDDSVVSIYRKSLLYLVSNSLESDLRTPILGLARVFDENDSGWDGSSNTGEALGRWRDAALDAGLAARTTVLDGDRITTASVGGKPVLQGAAHGSFDNDVTVVARTLQRIVAGAAPLALPVDDLRGY